MLADKVLGVPTAPVTMIEYSSLTCPHCASFHQDTLPQIKASYIDPGKVKLVYRDFPLDEPALTAAMVARCSGERYFAVIDLLFATQGTWARSTDTVGALKRAVAPAGMTSAEVDACVAGAELRSGILQIQAAGQSQYAVRATPTFIVGGQTIVGALPFADFDAILKRLTS
jgi:protein-disulfide isomerase